MSIDQSVCVLKIAVSLLFDDLLHLNYLYMIYQETPHGLSLSLGVLPGIFGFFCCDQFKFVAD